MPKYLPGQSGNPHGRPKKGQTFTDILDKVLLEEQVTYNGRVITGKEAAARKLLEMAIKGDMRAITYLADRIDGKPFQSMGIEGGNGNDLFQVFADLKDSELCKKIGIPEPKL